MSELTPATQMNHEQKIALDLWLGSATLFNDFKPITDRDLCIELMNLDIEVTKSTVDRWRKKFNFEGFLQMKISASMVEDKELRDRINDSASDAVIAKTIVDIDRNSNLAGDAYTILEEWSRLVLLKFNETKKISDTDAKMALSIAQLTTGREDKMFDRQALLGAAKLMSREDMIKKHGSVTIDVESEVLDIEG